MGKWLESGNRIASVICYPHVRTIEEQISRTRSCDVGSYGSAIAGPQLGDDVAIAVRDPYVRAIESHAKGSDTHRESA